MTCQFYPHTSNHRTLIEPGLIEYIIAILCGFLAGVINTLAGSGSAITLSVLTEVMGLPGNVANGTNRVGVLLASAAAFVSFHKNKKTDYGKSKVIVPTVFVGAIFGVIMAAFYTTDESFMSIFKWIMLLLIPIILLKPKRWLKLHTDAAPRSLYIRIPVYLALGFYAGFIQMGMGIFFLVTVVFLDRFDIISANAIKNFAVLTLTCVVIFIFHYRGLVNWQIGGILAIGQVTGAYLTAQFASKYKHADVWAYRILVLIVILVNLKLFGVISL